jgi:hypothetical protein
MNRFAMFGVLVLVGGLAFAEGKGAKKGDAKKDENAAMMAAMAKYGTPGAEHKLLKTNYVGSWTVAGKFFMAPGKPTESTGTAEVKSINNDLFTVEDFSGTFMGKPFTGHGISGYDIAKQKYTGVWADSMGSWMEMSEGTADATGKIITYTSTGFDPMTGKPSSHKMVSHIESDKKHVEEMFKVVDGKEVKEMELTYTRK